MISARRGVQGQKDMADIYSTQYFNVDNDPELKVKKVLELVYNAMTEKGYNPVNQIVGYIISGDPTYIEELLKEYIRNQSWKSGS